MNRPLLLLIAVVEGFASLGIEITALRRLVPHLGSSITITAPTIGLFLVALALGYHAGGQVRGDFLARVRRNFLLAALVAGIGLSPWAGRFLFAAGSTAGNTAGAGYLLFMLLVVCPAAWLLAQTVPLIANLVQAERPGEASGRVLAASTAGSVFGASLLPLWVMPAWGVSAAGWLCAASLVVMVLLAGAMSGAGLESGAASGATSGSGSGPAPGQGLGSGSGPGAGRWLPAPLAVLVATAAVNLASGPSIAETAYADYGLTRVPSTRVATDLTDPLRVFLVNNQWASILDGGDPPRPTPYVQRIQRLLVDDLGLRGKRILALGAGGFTLSASEARNRYVYVDVDPAIRTLAETHFLKGPITGEFVSDDARHFLLDFEASGRERFAAAVVDVFGSHAAVPAHLTTYEFWRLLPNAVVDGGVILINLILDPRLQSPFARNLLATIEAALGRCAVEVLNPAAPVASNVLVTCHSAPADAEPVAPPVIYTDERNPADRERNLRGY